MPNAPHLLLIGAGKMGLAMLGGWLDSGIANTVTAIDPQIPTVPPRGGYVWHFTDLAAVPAGQPFDAIVLAVKPQSFPAMLEPLHALLASRPEANPLILSIAAGKRLDWLQAQLPRPLPIVRAMPNTPAAVRAGISVCVANAAVDERRHELATRLLAAVGSVEWVEDEALLDAVTALSGGGPAYVFHLIEAMAAAGTAQGLPADLAMRLARQTVIGTGRLAEGNPAPAAEQRQAVTSPGGTTAEALKVLMDPQRGLPPLMADAIAAATARSRVLGEDRS